MPVAAATKLSVAATKNNDWFWVLQSSQQSMKRQWMYRQLSSISVISNNFQPYGTWEAPLSITNFWSLLKVMSIKLVRLFNHLILCHPLLLPPSIFPNTRVFPNESVLCIRWTEYWSFSFSISPSNDYSGLILFSINNFDLFVAQGTLKSLLQHHSSKALIFQCSAFFIVQLSHPYMTTGKTIALTRWTFVSKLMSLLFNMLSRFVRAFLPRNKCLLVSWLQTPSAVILGTKEMKSLSVYIVFPPICHDVMGLDAMISVFWMLSFKPAFSLFSSTFIKRHFSFS